MENLIEFENYNKFCESHNLKADRVENVFLYFKHKKGENYEMCGSCSL